MRLLVPVSVLVLALGAAACEGPRVVIHAPLDATVIDHHGDVPIAITITGDHVRRLALGLDGAPTQFPPVLDPPLPDDGDCSDGCAGTLHWMSDEATVGPHTIDLAAYDDRDVTGGAAPLALVFEDTLAASFTSPGAPDQRGAASIGVEAAGVYRGSVSWSLTIDGGAPTTLPLRDCRFGCAISAAWDTATLAAGAHPIAFTATDDAGHGAAGSMDVVIGDVMWASAIRVHGETDTLAGGLEVELHLEDATTGADLGCTGQGQGMEPVDLDDTDYSVDAHFVKPDGSLLAMSDLSGRTVRVHAIEDDDDPCPGNIGSWDDDMGTSTPVAAAQLPSVPSAFGEVVHLTMNVGRPYQR
jgi:hypothetical protein